MSKSCEQALRRVNVMFGEAMTRDICGGYLMTNIIHQI